MIRLSDVHFAYSGGGENVLNGVSLHIPRGQLTVLAGVNGSGKSTLLALVAGLFEPTAGAVALEGGELRDMVRLVLQDADLMTLGATVAEDLCLGLDHADETGRATARELARRFGLEKCWEAPVQTLSYGQKRKLTLAAALRDTPAVLCLDEPFAGLDYPATLEMRAILAEQKLRGLTQVVVSHDIEPLADLADSWAVLRDGKLIASGNTEQAFPHLLEAGVRPSAAWLAKKSLEAWPAPGASKSGPC